MFITSNITHMGNLYMLQRCCIPSYVLCVRVCTHTHIPHWGGHGCCISTYVLCCVVMCVCSRMSILGVFQKDLSKSHCYIYKRSMKHATYLVWSLELLSSTSNIIYTFEFAMCSCPPSTHLVRQQPALSHLSSLS
mgnify:CR=1 FL=1